MDELFKNPTFLVALIVAVAIVISLYGWKNYINPISKAAHDQNDHERNEVISLLKDRINILEDNAKKDKEDRESMKKRLEEISQEHELFKNILQGRDPDSIKSRERMNKAADIIDGMNDMLVKTYAKVMSVESLVKK